MWPPRYISHHRPPAISRKIGSMRRAGGGIGAERRSRNSVRVRSYALGSGAPVAVWPRARTRVVSPAVPTPHEYPGDEARSPVAVHESTVRVFRSRKGPGPRRARCPRAGRRALVVVRGAAAAGRALCASPRPVRRRRAAARAALRPRRGRCGRLRERALQHHRALAAADPGACLARPHRVVVGGRMRGRSIVGVRGSGRAGQAAPAPPLRRRRSRCRRREPHALGTSAGVRGHGAAGRAGGAALTARSQTSPFHIGMGEAAEVAGGGGAAARDRGSRDARSVRRRGRASRPTAQHTAARRGVWTGRASADTSPLSASRADEEQFPASTEQVRERRAGVGGRGRGRVRGGRVAARAGQEGGAAAEGDAVVGAHGHAAGARVPGRGRAAPLRDGAAAARALAARRRVTPPASTPRLHSIIGTVALAPPHAPPGVLYARYLFIGTGGRASFRAR